MAPSRKHSNGRSPLVNQQRQITSFFSKSTLPSPTLAKSETPNSNPNPSPSPTTPSLLESRPKKSLLVVGRTSFSSQSPSTTGATAVIGKSYRKEVVEKRIRVYWPLDKRWYEGCVKSYNESSGKHLVQYDDFEEELLDLGKEKIEWIEESARKLKRLRRGPLAFKKTVVEDDEEIENVKEDNGGDGGDDSSDEDWGMNVDKQDSEEEEDMELVDEVEGDSEGGKKKGNRGGKSESRKRKVSGGGKLGSGKKSKSGGDVDKEGVKVSVVEPVKTKESK